MSWRKRRFQVGRLQDRSAFESLDNTIELIEDLDYNVLESDRSDQKIIELKNGRGTYDLSITHDRAANTIYLGTELGRVSDPPREVLLDFLLKNSTLNHAHLSLDPVAGADESFRVIAT